MDYHSKVTVDTNTGTVSIDIDGIGGNDVVYTTTAASSNLSINNNGTVYKTAMITEDVTKNTFTSNTMGIVESDEAVRYLDSRYKDFIVGNNEANTFTYGNGGTDIYKGGTGNDVYNVAVSSFSNTDNRMIISDAAGNDTLNITSLTKDKLSMYFNVDKNGKIIDTNLSIRDKSVAKSVNESHITVANSFDPAALDPATAYAGDGKIEAINVGPDSSTHIDIATTINNIRTSVTGWLNAHHFASAQDVMDNGNQYDQASLLACYNNSANIAEL